MNDDTYECCDRCDQKVRDVEWYEVLSEKLCKNCVDAIIRMLIDSEA